MNNQTPTSIAIAKTPDEAHHLWITADNGTAVFFKTQFIETIDREGDRAFDKRFRKIWQQFKDR